MPLIGQLSKTFALFRTKSFKIASVKEAIINILFSK